VVGHVRVLTTVTAAAVAEIDSPASIESMEDLPISRQLRGLVGAAFQFAYNVGF